MNAEEIVRRVVANPPLAFGEPHCYCVWCRAVVRADQDHRAHEIQCPWRLAVAWHLARTDDTERAALVDPVPVTRGPRTFS